MNNKCSSVFKNGNFQKIDKDFIQDVEKVAEEIGDIQNKYNKKDIDTLFNEFHDSKVGELLGFKLCNVDKHGFDCKLNNKKDVFLESKVASFYSSGISATFNDTTEEKAVAFCDKSVYLALSVWKSEDELMFIVYGQNKEIGKYLLEKVKRFRQGGIIRSTQSLSISSLLLKYHFKILAVNNTKDEILKILSDKNSKLKDIDESFIMTVEEFNKNGGILGFKPSKIKKKNK